MAAPASVSEELYQQLIAKLNAECDQSKIKQGVFGAMMGVELVNDGPVTIEIDSNTKYPGNMTGYRLGCLL